MQGTAAEVLSWLLACAAEFIVRDDAAVPAERALTQIDILTEAGLPGLTR